MKKWEEIIETKVKPGFLAPWSDKKGEEDFKKTIAKTIDSINALKPEKDNTKCYLGEPNCIIGDEEGIKNVKDSVEMPEKASTMEEVIKEVVPYFNGMYNLAHPKTMFNVVPAPGIPSITGSFLGSMFNPNLVEQDYAGNVAALELEVAAMVSKLVGYDPQSSQGHFTFGGTGAYLFGTKLALTKCLGKESRFKGIREDAQLLVSKVGHFAAINCTDWTGLGSDNIRPIELAEDNSMDLNHLEETMEDCYSKGQPIAMITATVGTTDAFGIDDIKGITEVVDRFMKRHPDAKRPFIYADAVIGWGWCVFNDYDFDKNPMEFSEEALEAIKTAVERTKYLYLADAIGMDFHKTGFTSYNCTLVLVKDKTSLPILSRESEDMAYLYQFSAYTPGKYTFECSRGGNYPLVAWCNMKYFGLEGYRATLGELIEAKITLRKLIDNEDAIVCLNRHNYGFVTLFRVYPEELRAKYGDNFAEEQYENEFNDAEYAEDLKKFNDYQFKVAAELRRLTFEDNGPALSFTSGFRTNAYGDEVAAIKAYPMTPFRSDNAAEIKRDVVDYILKAAKCVDKK